MIRLSGHALVTGCSRRSSVIDPQDDLPQNTLRATPNQDDDTFVEARSPLH